MLIDALHAALEHREITLDTVCGYVAANVLFVAVLHSFVFRKVPRYDFVDAAFVCMNCCFLRDVRAHNPVHSVLIGLCYMERARLAAPLNQGEYRTMGWSRSRGQTY